MSDVRVETPSPPGLRGFLERIKQNQQAADLAMRESGFSGAPAGPTPYEQAKAQRSAEWWTSQEPSPSNTLDRFVAPTFTPSAEDLIKGKAGSGKQMGPEQTQASFEEYLASLGLGGGGGGGRPDFSGYRNALMGQADELNARIQAMYNQLAAQAGENMGRVQEIYGGAQEGVGSIYDSAAGNIQQAYGSAQEQAADQMARLGIEAAAPAVIDPMALSQAQAVSGLETGRAGGLSALGRYGSTAQDFGSQMAQVAQQQGTEMNAAILASLQNRLAESLAAEQGGGGGGGGGMSVSDMLKLQDAYRRDVQGELPLDERRFAFEIAQSAARPLNDWVESSVKRYMEAQFPRGSRINPEEYWAAEAAARQRARQQVGLE
jgi:uncharacterized protein YjbJ (UPF0337 family)